MRLPSFALVVALCSLPFPSAAGAQPPVQVQFGPSTPRVEFGTHINFLDLWSDASWTLGGRFSKRHADWLVSEVAYDRTSWKHNGETSRVLVAGLRLQSSTTRIGKRPFVSVGVARGAGMSFKWSPAISTGIQHEAPGKLLAFRMELQAFLRGRSLEAELRELPSNGNVTQWPWDRVRVLVGVGVGIP